VEFTGHSQTFVPFWVVCGSDTMFPKTRLCGNKAGQVLCRGCLTLPRRPSIGMLTHTRYIGSNIALLAVGVLVCLLTTFFAVMTGGFGADPVHDFRSGAIMCDLLAADLSFPIYLTMFRWCGLGSVAMWCIATLSFVICLVTGMFGPTIAFAILLLLQAYICQRINAASEKKDLPQEPDLL